MRCPYNYEMCQVEASDDDTEEQRDQQITCGYCRLSRAMDKWHGQAPRLPERVVLTDRQVMAYGEPVTLMTYEEALDHVLDYIGHTGALGAVMLASVGTKAYEIVMWHVRIGDLHYAGESDYVSTADAARLVDAGLAEYMDIVEDLVE